MTNLSTDQHAVQSVWCESDENYKQCLHSVFGKSIAEYFLSSSYLPSNNPGWYTEITDNMRGQISAKALWDTLRQRSTKVLEEMETETSQQVERMLGDWNMLKRQDHLQRLSGLRFMYRNAQHNQAYSMLLLQQRLQSPLCNLDTTEGPSQYLTEENTLVKE
ncbi:uncharacterized protein si:rp71-17i16.6 isoform X1 [Tachysurus vachellii]|uniref:uncharacterized protein si:rp71-17i16.6 isoform X1 n=1 Tax=Tachysurus vachellii TaxID=175792 RepID=UPI00296AEFC7|nr:uncharacterized protein si:rp71-17i16.6 isoform X1 [Tachysurus vachellii]XP_060750743.1 uncharacterized protein si:rp71-17i16.6 isoform X1 [Tachysurus vachellii]